MSEELKPCPFCGGAATEEWTGTAEFYGHEHQSVSIECGKCGVGLSIDTSCGKDGKPSRGYEFACSCCNDLGIVARDRWNRRAQSAEAEGVVAWAPSTALEKLRNRHNNAPCVLTDGPAELNDVPLVPLAALSAVTAERDRLESTLIQTTTRHFAQQWKDRADDKKLDECLSEGIAMLEADRDQLRAEIERMRGMLDAALYYVPEHKHDLRELISAAMAAKEA